ncbi:hypothetical protein FRC19_009578 [Serendipita sp. 401]|nr:hypothetical protein FRC19_009578 [Serendipita sp. 401]KAG9046811.1 hypothetical protein FS842_000798 [Serendipita sp. 407]
MKNGWITNNRYYLREGKVLDGNDHVEADDIDSLIESDLMPTLKEMCKANGKEFQDKWLADPTTTSRSISPFHEEEKITDIYKLIEQDKIKIEEEKTKKLLEDTDKKREWDLKATNIIKKYKAKAEESIKAHHTHAKQEIAELEDFLIDWQDPLWADLWNIFPFPYYPTWEMVKNKPLPSSTFASGILQKMKFGSTMYLETRNGSTIYVQSKRLRWYEVFHQLRKVWEYVVGPTLPQVHNDIIQRLPKTQPILIEEAMMNAIQFSFMVYWYLKIISWQDQVRYLKNPKWANTWLYDIPHRAMELEVRKSQVGTSMEEVQERRERRKSIIKALEEPDTPNQHNEIEEDNHQERLKLRENLRKFKEAKAAVPREIPPHLSPQQGQQRGRRDPSPSDSSSGSSSEGEPIRPPRRPRESFAPRSPSPSDEEFQTPDEGPPSSRGRSGRCKCTEKKDPCENKCLKAHLKTEYKPEDLPSWDGNPDKLIPFVKKANKLAKESDMMAKQIGKVIPRRFTDLAESWWDMMPEDRRDQHSKSWGHLFKAIKKQFMTAEWVGKQQNRALAMRFRQRGHEEENPLKFFYRKFESLDYTMQGLNDKAMIDHLMKSTPFEWATIIQIHRIKTVNELFRMASKCEEQLTRAFAPRQERDRRANARIAEARELYDSDTLSAAEPEQEAEVYQVKGKTPIKKSNNKKEWKPPKTGGNNAIRFKPPTFPTMHPFERPAGQRPKDLGFDNCRHCNNPNHWDYDCSQDYKKRTQSFQKPTARAASVEEIQDYEAYTFMMDLQRTTINELSTIYEEDENSGKA